MTFGRSILAATAGILLLVASASHAVAATVLYNDFTSPNWAAALSGLGITPVTASGDADFATKLNPLTVDLAIVQFDGDVHSSALQASLLTYIAAGGRVIFSSVADAQYDPQFSVSEAGLNMPGDFMTTIQVGGALSSGLSSSNLTVKDEPNLVTFWRSFNLLLTDPTATGLATFEDGNLGIVLGHNGRTIINGFGGSTLYANESSLSPADEVRLYQNEVGLLVAAVPEPATGALLGLGLIITAALGYRRRK
jgi:hypothetical protein